MKNIFRIILVAFVTASCQQTGSAPALQSHLAAAKTGSAQTQASVQSAKSHLDTSDYKSQKIQGLLKQGVEQ